MQKALSIFGMVVAALILLIFGMDMATGYPFHSSWKMDLPFVVCSLILGYLGWSSLREQD
jgi:hypothetical protein